MKPVEKEQNARKFIKKGDKVKQSVMQTYRIRRSRPHVNKINERKREEKNK